MMKAAGWIFVLCFAACDAMREPEDEDYVIVQHDAAGHVVRCYELHGVSEWEDTRGGCVGFRQSSAHLRISVCGLVSTSKVSDNHWTEAFRALGMTAESCRAIREHPPTAATP